MENTLIELLEGMQMEILKESQRELPEKTQIEVL